MTEHRRTVTEVVAKLQTYGSADQLAAFFEEQGVVGERSFSLSCPVANYVRRQIPNAVVGVSGLCVTATTIGPNPRHRVQIVELSFGDPVTEFINRFDAGHYPALERA